MGLNIEDKGLLHLFSDANAHVHVGVDIVAKGLEGIVVLQDALKKELSALWSNWVSGDVYSV